MPRYTPVTLPQGGVAQNAPQKQQGHEEPLTPMQAGFALGQAVRDEHGREGVRAYVTALNPLLPRALIEQLAQKFGVEAPPHVPPSMPHAHHAPSQEPPPKPPQKDASPGIPPELLMQLLQNTGGGGGGGLDPSMLMKLLQK